MARGLLGGEGNLQKNERRRSEREKVTKKGGISHPKSHLNRSRVLGQRAGLKKKCSYGGGGGGFKNALVGGGRKGEDWGGGRGGWGGWGCGARKL